ncbi:hypothetical protein BH20ACT15_BH20ACT15_06840 [soil metagenome]
MPPPETTTLGTLPLALAGGSWIVLAVLIVFVFVVAYSLFTRLGSGMNPRHDEGEYHSGGSEDGDEAEESDENREEGAALKTHGTK